MTLSSASRKPTSYLVRKRAAIYLRVSRRRQAEKGTSLASQEEHCKKFVEENRFTFDTAHLYKEIHTGREYYERPEMTNLREAAKRHEFDVIFVYAYDRLARKQVHQAYLIDELRQLGIEVISVTEPQVDDSPIGEYLRNTYGLLAELERIKIVERTQEGRRRRITDGKLLPGGHPLYGYLWADTKKTRYVLNETIIYVDTEGEKWSEVRIIRYIFSLAKQGMTLRSIAARLSQEGIPMPNGGTVWRASAVSKILSNPYYAGRATAYMRQYDKETGGKRHSTRRPLEEQIPYKEGIVPAIVDAETFDEIQEQLRRNRQQAPRNNKHPEETLLNYGLAICGVCGRRMQVKRQHYLRKRKGMVTFVYYVCGSDTKQFGGCLAAKIKAETLDNAVWEHVAAIIKNPKLVAQKLEEQKKENPASDELTWIDARLSQIDEELENLVDMGQKSASIAARNRVETNIAQLEEEQRQLFERKNTLLTVEINWEAEQAKLADFEAWCSNWRKNLPNATYEKKRYACEQFHVKAVVWPRDPISKQPKYEIQDYPLAVVSRSS